MNDFLSRIYSSLSNTPSKHTKRTLGQKLFGPLAGITEPSEQRQSSLVSLMLFTITVSMISGVVYMGFIQSNLAVGLVLAGAQVLMAVAFILSRTRYYRSAVILSLIVLSIIPVLNLTLGSEHSSEELITLLIWNILTILLSSAITSTRNTLIFIIFDILTLTLIPAFIPGVTYKNMTLPLIFNCVISIVILVLTLHRNLMEKDRLLELSRTNKQLQIELTERKRAEKLLAHTALHDSLTDLPNRVLFMDRLSQAMQRAKRRKGYMYAVLFLDLDRFKVINDSLGHNIGDQLLIESSQRLAACLRGEDTVARFGGDEFVVLLDDIQDSSDAIRVSERIQNDLSVPYDLDGYRVIVFVSTGIVFSNTAYERPDDIVRDADIAMYRSKGKGLGRYEIFDPSMLDRVMTRLELETDLRKALENQEFVVHYQPILEMKTNQIIGFEALVRWQHPTKGLIPPAEFIPTAEETGLIVPLGYWVLDEACHQLHAWHSQYPADPPLTINVNLSTRQCSQPDLVKKISMILKKNELDPHFLKLELTESLIIDESGSTAAMLSELRDKGIQVQIDDFGTGYSSLSYLHTLPIDTLKIDRSFISRLGGNTNNTEIVQTIFSLAHNLGMKVIAEGVETNEQLSSLKAMHCEFVQGFLFAKPINNLEAGAMLGKSHGKVDPEPFIENS
jgi:diguanylate cyclase (GGDEF)-like protein